MLTVNGTAFATIEKARDAADRLENAGIRPEVSLQHDPDPAPSSQLPAPSSPIFLAGFPGDVGGANTEIWHTLKLWRGLDLDVRVLPTWGAAQQTDYGRWCLLLAELGVKVCCCQDPRLLPSVDDLPGSIVVSFCNTRFVHSAGRFRAMGCKTVYVPCMCTLAPSEATAVIAGDLADRWVFQSEFQRARLEADLRHWTAQSDSPYQSYQGWTIRGAFDPEAFEFRPATPRRERHHVGRISRPHPAKFRPDLWKIFAAVNRRTPIHAHVLGWGHEARDHCGEPPAWATCYEPGLLPPYMLLRCLHVLVQMSDPNGLTPVENWPRVGLEAMAAGVPIVADDRGGWAEMIQDGKTGFLVSSPAAAVDRVCWLLDHPDEREEMAHAARFALENDLANPTRIGWAWLDLFESLSTSP